MRPNPSVEGDAQDAWIEETSNPHESGDLDMELVSRPVGDADDLKKRAAQRIRITKNDLLNYGYTDKCPKCMDLKNNEHFTMKHHNEACRARLYGQKSGEQRSQVEESCTRDGH